MKKIQNNNFAKFKMTGLGAEKTHKVAAPYGTEGDYGLITVCEMFHRAFNGGQS